MSFDNRIYCANRACAQMLAEAIGGQAHYRVYGIVVVSENRRPYVQCPLCGKTRPLAREEDNQRAIRAQRAA